jgi:hypothetical protein
VNTSTSRRNFLKGAAAAVGVSLLGPRVLALVASPQRPSHSTSTSETRLRRSVTALRVSERKGFVDAVLALKGARSPYNSSLSYYDQFVQWHKDRYACNPAAQADASTMQMVHTGPMFLPWHQEHHGLALSVRVGPVRR